MCVDTRCGRCPVSGKKKRNLIRSGPHSVVSGRKVPLHARATLWGLEAQSVEPGVCSRQSLPSVLLSLFPVVAAFVRLSRSVSRPPSVRPSVRLSVCLCCVYEAHT